MYTNDLKAIFSESDSYSKILISTQMILLYFLKLFVFSWLYKHTDDFTVFSVILLIYCVFLVVQAHK